MFEAIFRGGARQSYAALCDDERREVDSSLRLIELDPFEPSIFKTSVILPPIVLIGYNNGIWHFTYRIVEPFIEVYGIERLWLA